VPCEDIEDIIKNATCGRVALTSAGMSSVEYPTALRPLSMPRSVMYLRTVSDRTRPESSSFTLATSAPAMHPPTNQSINQSIPSTSFSFLQRAAMLAVQALYYLQQFRLSVCLSVRPSHAGMVSKRLHAARCSWHCQIAKCNLIL